MTTTNRILALIAIVVITCPSSAFAGRKLSPQVKRHLKLCRLAVQTLDKLKLSESAQSSMASILSDYRDNVFSTLDEKRSEHQDLRDAMYENDFEESSVRQAWQDYTDVKEEAIADRALAYSQMKPILNDKQYNMMVNKRGRFIACFNSSENTFNRSVMNSWLGERL